jgi:hypothetical protein
VQQLQVYVQQAIAVYTLTYIVGLPNFVIKRLGHNRGLPE